MQWRTMRRNKEFNPDEAGLAWEKKNEWFGIEDHQNIEATRIASITHEYLVALSYLEVNSEEYFKEINNAVNKYFPDLAKL